MATRSSFCIAALLCLITSILAAPPLQLSSSSTTGTSLTLPVNSSSLTLPLNISSVNLGADPLPPYPPPDPLAYQVPNSPVILVFSKYLTQRRDETWIQIAISSADSECSQHQPAEPLQNQIYTWNYKRVDLVVKPVTEPGGPSLTWGLWKSAVNGIQEFQQKYEGVGREGVGIRMNFEILVSANTRRVDAQFAIGKGFLDMV
ncbi:hypothetical protein IMSHALPRED_005672 [Imshaugia aleurites]|uniref:Uncharacterized protein n=1 Tax=Imshaugia aleurites TaxID=172621 RepID=A0A8H3FBS1_9LECA|nr:hypothetical protein IMSHALPRED_005672 [Imshaugia aleurites]